MSFLLFDLDGTSLTKEERELLKNPKLAGAVLFARNFENFRQLTNLIADIRELTKDRRFLMTVDQEGGRVQRFANEFSPLPAPGDLMAMATSTDQFLHLCYEFGWLMAAEIRAAGIDISFAPVADVDIGLSAVIGTRSFGSDPAMVISAVSAYVNGMATAGMAATIKHFPGHGGISADSHTSSPVDHRNLDDLRNTELGVFEHLITKGVAGLMPAHVIYDAVDKQPASFSHFWLIEYLRHQLGFDGCVFSDDLTMQAAQSLGKPAVRAELALNAGCDVILCCNDRAAVIEILDNVSWQGSNRWHKLCAKSGLNADKSQLKAIQSTPRYKSLTSYFKRT